jgi:hypothetical protein
MILVASFILSLLFIINCVIKSKKKHRDPQLIELVVCIRIILKDELNPVLVFEPHGLTV